MDDRIIGNLGVVLGIAAWRMRSTTANEMVGLWFQRVDEVDEKCRTNGGLTWESLEGAMRHPTVGLVGTANEIKEQRLGQ